MQIAREHGIQSIAFPAISTGIFIFPQREAADIAIEVVVAELAAHALPRRVVLCMYDELAMSIMQQAWADAVG